MAEIPEQRKREFDVNFKSHWDGFKNSNVRVFLTLILDKQFQEVHNRLEDAPLADIEKLQGRLHQIKQTKSLLDKINVEQELKDLKTYLNYA